MQLRCLIVKNVLKLVLKKGVFLTKLYFFIKRSMEISGKGLLNIFQQISSLMGNQTNHMTNVFIHPTLAMSEFVL